MALKRGQGRRTRIVGFGGIFLRQKPGPARSASRFRRENGVRNIPQPVFGAKTASRVRDTTFWEQKDVAARSDASFRRKNGRPSARDQNFGAKTSRRAFRTIFSEQKAGYYA
jgi:hypothetical protein